MFFNLFFFSSLSWFLLLILSCPCPSRPRVTTHLHLSLRHHVPPALVASAGANQARRNKRSADEVGRASFVRRHLAEGSWSCALEEPLGRLPGGREQVEIAGVTAANWRLLVQSIVRERLERSHKS